MTSSSNEKLTRAHYDAVPFDALTRQDEKEPRRVQPAPFLRFCDTYLATPNKIAEIGCGPGRGTMFLVQAGHDVTAVDISEASVARARRRAPGATFLLASNLDLPLANELFDAVISDGVIHHTPDAFRSFSENARILKGGGVMYLGVYNRHRYYYYLYTYLGPPIRAIERNPTGRSIVSCTLLPAYYLLHLVKSRGKRTWAGARSFFYDYIITPRATFHSRAEIERWGDELGLELLEYDPSLGNVHAFFFRKRADRFDRYAKS